MNVKQAMNMNKNKKKIGAQFDFLGIPSKFNHIYKHKSRNKNKKQRWLDKISKYLVSDSYLYSPLLCPENMSLCSSDSEDVEMTSEVKRKQQRLLEKVKDYLKTDYYMYAPLIGPSQPISPFKEHPLHIKSVTVEFSSRKWTRKENLLTVEAARETIEEYISKGRPDKCISHEKVSVHEERLKHHLYRTCCSSSVPGKTVPDSHSRKIVID